MSEHVSNAEWRGEQTGRLHKRLHDNDCYLKRCQLRVLGLIPAERRDRWPALMAASLLGSLLGDRHPRVAGQCLVLTEPSRVGEGNGRVALAARHARPKEKPRGARSRADFEGFRHGYAGTIYKGQGKTLDRTYLYHTEHWRSAASYVALTRQRESAQVFVARETARDAGQLARQMGRGEVRAASVAWAAADDLPRAQQERERPERQAEQPEAPRPEARAKTAQADPGKSYWQSLTRKPEAAQDEDSLRAKVRGKLAARQGVNAKEDRCEPQQPDGLTEAQRQLRREMQALDRPALAEAARVDQVGRSFETRPMTVRDAARLVSLEYATAADRADGLRRTAAEVGKAIEYNERVQRSGREQGDRRWKDMGIVRQTMHKTGARLDPAITASESTEGKAMEELKKLDVQRAQLARFVPIAERAEAAAFRQAEPAATAELAKRQERASVAREVLGEQRRQEVAREQTLKRSRGLGLDR